MYVSIGLTPVCMIFNLLSKSISFVIKTSISSPLNFRLFSRTTPKKGLEEFFENGEAFPIYNQEKKVPIGKKSPAVYLCTYVLTCILL